MLNIAPRASALLVVLCVASVLHVQPLSARPVNPAQLQRRSPTVSVNGVAISTSTLIADSEVTGTHGAAPDLPILRRIRDSIQNWNAAAAANGYSGAERLLPL